MRSILVGFFVLCLGGLSGCAASKYGLDFNPITGTIGAHFETDGTQIAATTTLPGVPAERSICEGGDRGTAQRIVSAQAIYGRGFAPFTNAARGIGSRDIRAVSREVNAQHEDLKREVHNAKVARCYTNERSMASSFLAFWGYHPCPIPLESSLQAQPIVAEVVTSTPSTPLPPIDHGLPPSGLVPPPDGADKAVHNSLVKRVELLETRVNGIDGKLDLILAAVKK